MIRTVSFPMLSLICLYFLALTEASGQVFSSEIDLADTTQQHLLITKRGDRIVGRIEKIEGTMVYFLMRTGNVINFTFQEIEWVGLQDEKRAQSGSSRRPAPERPRLTVPRERNGCENLLFSPSAFNYEKDRGEYRNIQVILNTADYGLSDHFSVGGGIIIPFIFVTRFKGTIDYNEYLHLGAGTSTFIPISQDLVGPTFTHFYGVVTLGTPKAYLNATAGYGFSWGSSLVDNPGDLKTVPLVTSFGGSITLVDRLRVVVDVAYLKGNDFNDVFPSLSLGWIGRLSRFEVGLLSTLGIDTFAIPMLSYARRF